MPGAGFQLRRWWPAGAAVIAIGSAAFWLSERPERGLDDTTNGDDMLSAVTEPADVSEDGATSDDAGDEVALAAPTADRTVPSAEPTPDLPDTKEGPSFDLVRVEPDGRAQVAGRGAPNASVEILVDGQVAGEASSGGDGSFFAMLDLGAMGQARELTLRTTDATGVEEVSRQTVLIAPAQPATGERPEGDAPSTLAAAPEIDGASRIVRPGDAGAVPETGETARSERAEAARDERDDAVPIAAGAEQEDGTEPVEAVASAQGNAAGDGPGGTEAAAEQAVVQTDTGVSDVPATPEAPGAGTANAPEAVDGADPASAGPTVLLAEDRGVRVLQRPDRPEAQSVVIDTISYDAAGEVVLSGRGKGRGFVRVYLDNRAIRTSEISADGSWQAELPTVERRVYTLRVDEIGDDGAVVSRVETPFRPEAPEALARLVEGPDGTRNSVVTVQPGFTLWQIARENYGQGMLYVRVFDANSDKIRDPDLIYPGQVFTVPE